VPGDIIRLRTTAAKIYCPFTRRLLRVSARKEPLRLRLERHLSSPTRTIRSSDTHIYRPQCVLRPHTNQRGVSPLGSEPAVLVFQTDRIWSGLYWNYHCTQRIYKYSFHVTVYTEPYNFTARW